MKEILNYEGRYSIDENGNVYSYKTKRYIKQWVDKHTGYYFVRLAKNNDHGKNYPVHRLLAQAFIDNPNNYKTVDHINRNKLDNNLTNLRWASYTMQRANEDDTNIRQKSREKCSNGITNPLRPTIMLNDNHEVIMKFKSLADASRYAGASSSVIIFNAIKYKRKCKGYYWEYE